LRQSQTEIHSIEAGYSQCRTSSGNVSKIVTIDDLAPNIGIQGISDSATRGGATDNKPDSTGYDESEEQNF